LSCFSAIPEKCSDDNQKNDFHVNGDVNVTGGRNKLKRED